MSSPHPFLVLQITDHATDEQVRAAYRRLVRQYPPDHAPEQFQQVNAAYEAVKTAERRASLRLFGSPHQLESDKKLAEFAPPPAIERTRIGIDSWLQILRKARS